MLNSPAKGLPAVVHDAEESGRMAAEHLMVHGYRRFAYLGLKRDRCAALQLAGFKEVLKQGGYVCSTCWTSHHSGSNGARWQRFQTQLDEWIGTWSPPLAIFATTDLLNRYLLDACHRHGLKVPGDVALLDRGQENAYNEASNDTGQAFRKVRGSMLEEALTP